MNHRKPLAIDLYAGLGGWSEGLLAEGWNVVGFDIERHHYGEAKYPAQLVIQDVLTIHGKQFASADLIVASPPCQEYSYMAMPWSRAKQIEAEYLNGTRNTADLTALFDACFRIQREACEASGRYIPLVVENVRGAQKWVGRSRYHFGSFHLWGDVPALMPLARKPIKVPGFRFDGSVDGMKMGRAPKGPNGVTRRLTNPGEWKADDWFGSGSDCSLQRQAGSRTPARKAASAQIAKIPFVLSSHIARAWKPHQEVA